MSYFMNVPQAYERNVISIKLEKYHMNTPLKKAIIPMIFGSLYCSVSAANVLPVMGEPETLNVNEQVVDTTGNQAVMMNQPVTKALPSFTPNLVPNVGVITLPRPHVVVAVESMPMINNTFIKPVKGNGLQQEKRSVVKSNVVPNKEASHLHLVMEVDKAGNVNVLSAVKVQGTALNTTEALGDFIYDIKLANKPVLVQAIPDPFEMRAFPAPKGSGLEGHHFEKAKVARMVVRVPTNKVSLQQLSTIKMDLYRLNVGKPIEKIDRTIFNKLKLDKRIKTITTIPAIKLAPQIREKMIIPSVN